MCTSYPRISAIFADCNRALCRCILLFCSLFQFPLGKQGFQYVSDETRTYTRNGTWNPENGALKKKVGACCSCGSIYNTRSRYQEE